MFKNSDTLKKMTVLYLEDDAELRENTSKTLNFFVKEVYSTSDVKGAKKTFEEKNPSLIISDIELQGENGLDFVEWVREKNKTIPIVVISAHTAETYLLRSVKLQLTEFIKKPMTLETLTNALDSAAEIYNGVLSESYSLPNGKAINYSNYTVSNGKEIIPLTGTETSLLKLLISNENKCVSYEQIEKEIWGGEEMSKGSLKTIINKIRKKVGEEYIKNISGQGYLYSTD